MSLTFSIAHNQITKKVSCPRSNTVNQLASLAIAKFGLPLSANGTLLHSGKKLDGLLPLRLTNLVNNAKLVLEVSSALRPVTVKVVASVLGELKQKIIKTQTDSTVQQLLDTFSADSGAQIGDHRVQLSVLDARIENGSTDFTSTLLGSILGSANNAVIRLTVESKDAHSKREKLQAEQRELRQQLEEHKRQARLLEKRLKEEAQETEKKEEPKEEEEVEPELKDEKAELKDEEAEAIEEPVVQDSIAENPGKDVDMDVDEPQSKPEEINALDTKQEASALLNDSFPQTPSDESFKVQHFKEDTVYIPLNRSQHYENPDNDYNLTVSQAEKYYGIIKSMQQNKKQQPKEVVPPKAYIIRVRFPDRALLDLQIEDSSMKLGQLLKKLDSFVHEKHINTYRLKNGVPPFEEIAMGFDANNKELKHHKSFQDERIMLIWESTDKSAKGPYLKLDVNTRNIDDLPTLQLESHRGQLGDEEEKRRKSILELNQSKQPEKKKKNGLPKWFKPGK